MIREVTYSRKDLRAIEHLLPAPDPEVVLPARGGPRRVIKVSETRLDGNEAAYLRKCLSTNWVSSAGPLIREFERKFAKRVGCRYGIACTSGTTALHLTMAALGLKPRDEVILPTFTMIATPNCVTYTGARPVLVDAEPRTGNMDIAQVEAKITRHTRAIIVVHTYGHPAAMKPLQRLAAKHGLTLVEDAAEAHGASYGGRPVGSLGDAAAFSFYGNKIITTGEGGMVTTNNAEYARLVRTLRDHAFSPERHFWHKLCGFNYRMTNMQAAVGLAQTERLGELVAIRRRSRRLYEDGLREIAGISLLEQLPGVKPVNWMNCIMVGDEFGCSRNALRRWLASGGIETRAAFIPIHLQPVYHRKYRGQRFPVAENICRRGILLPSGPKLTEREIAYIAQRIASAPRKG